MGLRSPIECKGTPIQTHEPPQAKGSRAKGQGVVVDWKKVSHKGMAKGESPLGPFFNT